MLILLPPSEGKTAARRGAPLDIERLSFPELSASREQVLQATIDAAQRTDAPAVFKVSGGAIDEARANADLRTAHTAPAWQTYTGVLYDALGYNSLDAAAKRRAGRRIVVCSALFGALRLSDRIPAYRLSGSVRLPGIGSFGTFWSQRLEPVLDDLAGGLVVDCRSAAYAAMWRHPDAIGVRVFRDAGGKRTVVTHMAKQSRGRVARALSQTSDRPRTTGELAEVLGDYFARTPVHTATGVAVSIKVEHTDTSIDIITD